MREADMDLASSRALAAAEASSHAAPLELTILMPCLDEAETIGACIEKARSFLGRTGIAGEVLVADNGSTDGSVGIAEAAGARVVHVKPRGYGAALIAGLAQARGTYVIMGDADGSYDFEHLEPFVGKLRDGADLVIGDRFRGGIAPGAMKPLHRFFGNPALSFIGRLFFPPGVKDFHCGLRGGSRDAMLALGLRMPGMEFASEMVVRASLAKLNIAEVPTTLVPDGRSRDPHLRTWQDGWRHLRFLLLFSPNWLFLYPGLAILSFGIVVIAALLPGPVAVTPHITLDIHTFIVGCIALLIGTQCISFATLSRRYARARGFLPEPEPPARPRVFTLETVLVIAGLGLALGIGGLIYCVFQWGAHDFGPLSYPALLRILMISCTLAALSIQIALTAFLSELFKIDG